MFSCSPDCRVLLSCSERFYSFSLPDEAATVISHMVRHACLSPTQDLLEQNWQGAIGNIKAAAQGDQVESMVELLLAKLLAEDKFQELLEEHLPALSSISALPGTIKYNLGLVLQMVRQDLQEATTFNGLIQELQDGKRKPVLRVIFAEASEDSHGMRLLGNLSQKNQHLLGCAEKIAKIEEILEHVTTEEQVHKLCHSVSMVADIHFDEAELQGSLKSNLQSICAALEVKTDLVSRQFKDAWEAVADIAESEAVKEMESLADFLAKPSVVKFLASLASEGMAKSQEHLLQLRDTVPRH